jgi:predicted MPP superfamily phosphohydrolase
MGNCLTLPMHDGLGLGDKVMRWRARWRQGGVENYSDGENAATRSSWNAGQPFTVDEERIWIDTLPDVFGGLRVVQISDIHHGLFLSREILSDAVRQTNRLNPDIVALTGDYVTYSRANIEPAAEILGRLRARYGVFAVLGNHDFRVDANNVTSALQRHHIDVLRNRHVELRFGGKSMFVAGVDDYGYGADLRMALRTIPPQSATILLAHNPRIITRAARYGVSLVLSGHTHGGQVNIPLLGTVYGRSPEKLRFKIGWDQMAGTQIYVSRGLGTIVLPWRLRCPAEISRLELLPGVSDSSHVATTN